MSGRWIGEFSWTPPPWLDRPGRLRFVRVLSLLVALAGLAAAIWWLATDRTSGPHLVAQTTPPGLATLVDGALVPQPLEIDFEFRQDPERPREPVTSFARLDLVDQVVTDGVRLVPDIAGEWRWVGDKRLSFMPAGEWPAGTEFTVRLESSLFAPELILGDDQLVFDTVPLTARVEALRFHQHPEIPEDRRIAATIRFSHPVAQDELETSLALRSRAPDTTIDDADEALGFALSSDDAGRTWLLRSEIVELPDRESFATLSLTNTLASTAGGATLSEPPVESVRIPDRSTFFRVEEISSRIVRDEDDTPLQRVLLQLSDGIEQQTLRRGLSVYLLPRQKNADSRRTRPYRWRDPGEVGDEVLRRADSVNVRLAATERNAPATHAIEVDEKSGRFLFIELEAGTRSANGFDLAVPYRAIVPVPAYPAEVHIAGDGGVIPLTGERELTVLTRGQSALRVTLAHLNQRDVHHLATQTRGDITHPYFLNYALDQNNLTTRDVRFVDLVKQHPREANYVTLDLSALSERSGFGFVTVEGWNRQQNRREGGIDRRFVLLTDLGLVIKTNADSRHDVYLHSLSGGGPVTDATIQLLGRNGVALFELTTGPDGHARSERTEQYADEQQPAVWLARRGNDQVFLPYARSERMLQLSRFDVGGEYAADGPDAARLRGFVFSDRGLYRPGDEIHIGGIVKRDDWATIGNAPFSFDLVDPAGRRVLKTAVRPDRSGLFSVDWQSDVAGSTGQYQATLYVLDNRERRQWIGSTAFRVEEFQPDTMRIRSVVEDGSPGGAWLDATDVHARVELNNLFGTAAAGRRVSATATLTPAIVPIERFASHRFETPGHDERDQRSIELAVPDGETGPDGVAELELDLGVIAKGTYRLDVATRGFDAAGGRSVAAAASAFVSGNDVLVGYRTDVNTDWVPVGSQFPVHLQAVDRNGDATAVAQATLRIEEEQSISALIQQDDGTYAYQSIERRVPVASEAAELGPDGLQTALPTDTPGRFVAVLLGARGERLTEIDYVVAGGDRLAGAIGRNAELDLIVNGDSFRAGSRVEYSITAPYDGYGLVTLEREKVYRHRWIRASAGQSTHAIDLPGDIEGNVYLSVAFVRDLGAPEVLINPLSYAVAPIAIDRDTRNNEVVLDVTGTAIPGERLSVRYRSERPARIVLFAVDEGILQAGSYATPDPLGFFLRKLALQVSTFQMADLLLPDLTFLSTGRAPGGGAGARLLGKNLNPFRRLDEAPVAFWSGPLDAGPDAADWEFELPDYFNGSLRIMAVAAGDESVGASTATTIVRAPIVLSPTAPLAVSPGDEFDVVVGVANNIEGTDAPSNIAFRAELDAAFEVLDGASQALQIAPGREGRAVVRVRAGPRPGSAGIRLVAGAGNIEIGRATEISIRPAAPYRTSVTAGSTDRSRTTLEFERSLLPEFASQRAAAAVTPLVLADGLLDYLAGFPHACTEQIVSKVFPQLAFLGGPDPGADEPAIRALAAEAIRKLEPRQRSDGGFSFWLGASEAAEFPSIYALHFLTDASERGVRVPDVLLAQGREYLRRLAGNPAAATLADARLRAYAIYVLTRQNEVTTSYVTNLNEQLERDFTKAWRSDVTALFVAATYRMMKQERLARELVGDVAISLPADNDTDFDTALARNAQIAYLLLRHFPQDRGRLGNELIDALAAGVMAGRFNTVSAAYATLALSEWPQSSQGDRGRVQVDDEPPAEFVRKTIDSTARSVALALTGAPRAWYTLTQQGYDERPPQKAVAEGIELERRYLDSNGEPITEASAGQPLTVVLRSRSTGRARSNVALVDLIPGGFEIDLASVRDNPEAARFDNVDVREDRLVLYGTFGTDLTEFRYRLIPVAAGNFTAPPAYAEAMYDRFVRAVTPAGTLSVVRPD